ncbi:hypothetical protein HET73_03830 [Wolbachia endosymbiont of Atemnus politus]|uniref:hypothetical protein n=1 Tax=Wolbachia endosymbiont of Atemnus politus TaxID=2682840 RepID=UPI0015727040|nr:hypothetical protein [Wolbachia endosymbiont of Atemnus politus]NSM56606.1 hypothetical protein [Wolbachia endosymbiont of Atemnus politus]
MVITVLKHRLAIGFNDQGERAKIILDAAEEAGILKYILAGIGKNNREKVKALFKRDRDNDMLDKIYKVETSMAIDKAMKTGSICGVRAALAVGIGCGVADIGLPILAIVGIALAAAAVLVGFIAYGITYVALKPSNELDKTNVQGLEVPVDIGNRQDF